MSDELLKYYNRELAYLRHLGADFSERYPKVAGNLRITEEHVEDPHVSRLLEGVSLMTAQIRQKLDDSFPELTEALLGQLYPDYHAPIPSMSVIKMSSQYATDNGLTIPKGSPVETQSPGFKHCYFKTCYATKVWPFEVTEAKFEQAPFKAPKPQFEQQASAMLKVTLSCNFDGVDFSAIGVDSLRFHLHGQSQLTTELYQLLMENTVGMALAKANTTEALHYLQPRHLQPVGFEDNQKVVPYSQSSFDGYRLLIEHFICPEKFLFVELKELQAQWFGYEDEVDLYFYFNQDSELLAKQLTKDNFLLGCTPVINLFEANVEPIRLEPSKFEHQLVTRYSDAESSEIVRLLKVEAFDQHDNCVSVNPFYGSSVSHSPHNGNLFWTLRREIGQWAGGFDEAGVESYLSVVDGNTKGIELDRQDKWLVTATALCSNRNLPARLPFGGGEPQILVRDFAGTLKAPQCLNAFSEPVRPAMFDASRWQLITHLSLTHFSQQDGTEKLKQILQLYDFKQTVQSRVVIDAIQKVKVQRTTSRVVQSGKVGVCHGSEIVVEFSHKEVGGASLYLFGSVLARFFAQFAAINSFVKLTIKRTGNIEPLHQWSAMCGDKELL